MRTRLLCAIALILFLTYHIVYGGGPWRSPQPGWESYTYMPDSASYLPPYDALHAIRPPLYPWFIETVSEITVWDSRLAQHPVNRAVVPAEALPELLKVVQAQKLVFIASAAIAALALMSVAPPLLVTVLMAVLYGAGFFSSEQHALLTESLAQSALLLIVAATVIALRYRSAAALLACAAFSAALYHIRPAGAFSVVFPAAVGISLLADRKLRALPACAAAALLFGALFFAPGIYRYLHTGHFQSSGIYADLKIQFALQIASESDLDLMPDPQARAFLDEALRRKPLEDRRMLGAWDEQALQIGFPFLTTNLYYNAFPVSNAMGLSSSEARVLYARVAEPILREHRLQYLLLSARSMWYAVTRQTRLKAGGLLTFPLLALLYLALCFRLRGTASTLAAACLAAQLAHLAIVCSHDQPIVRYVHANEFLVLLGAALLLVRGAEVVRERRRGAASHSAAGVSAKSQWSLEGRGV